MDFKWERERWRQELANVSQRLHTEQESNKCSFCAKPATCCSPDSIISFLFSSRFFYLPQMSASCSLMVQTQTFYLLALLACLLPSSIRPKPTTASTHSFSGCFCDHNGWWRSKSLNNFAVNSLLLPDAHQKHHQSNKASLKQGNSKKSKVTTTTACHFPFPASSPIA